MAWHTEGELIMNGNLLAGSIVEREGRWFVEIPLNDTDVCFDSADRDNALAFIEGVEKTLAVIGGL